MRPADAPSRRGRAGAAVVETLVSGWQAYVEDDGIGSVRLDGCPDCVDVVRWPHTGRPLRSDGREAAYPVAG